MIEYQRPRSPRHDKNVAYYQAHRDELLAKSKVWREANRERQRAYKIEHRKRYPDRIADGKLRGRVGIGLAAYHELFTVQGGVCAICGRPETAKSTNGGLRRFLTVDHDHATGEIRGLLCSACNTGIGQLGDDPDRLHAAIAYLERETESPKIMGQPLGRAIK